MKKIIFGLILVGLLSNMSSTVALQKGFYKDDLSDNLYVEYTIEEIPSSRLTQTRIGKKTASVKSGSTVLWTVTVTGTFEYTGSTSICTASSVTTTCPATNWKITSKSASKSGATASAKATASRYNNGSVVETKTESVFLVCGSDGTLY